MSTPIGYAAVQLIPSLEGFSAAVDKELGGKLQVVGKQHGQKLGTGIADGLKTAEDAYTKLRNKAEDSLGKIRVAELALTKARASSDATRIATAEERLNKAHRDSAVAVRDAERAYKTYEEAQKRSSAATVTHGRSLEGLSGTVSKLTGSLSGMVGALGPLGGALEGAAGSATGLGGSMLSAASGAGIMGGAVAAAAVGLGAIVAAGGEAISKLYEIGSAFNEMGNVVAFKTGATGADLTKLTDTVKAVASETSSSIGQIGVITADVSRSLHLTGEDLTTVTKSIADLDERTGEATNIRDLGKAFRGFGVDAASQNDALNQLYTASTRTGQSVNDLIHNVTIGGAPLRELGLDFGHSAALMSSFENAGLDGTKMVTGLRKAVGEFAKEHKDIPKALADSVTQLKAFKDAGDEASGIDLANKLFGPKTGVAFWDAIRSGALDLESLSGGLQGTTLSITDMADQTESAGQKWDKLKNKFEVGIQPLASKIFDIGQSGLEDLTKWIDTHHSSIINFFTDIGVAGIRAFQGIALVLGPTMETLGSTINALKTISDWTGIGSVIDLGDAPQKMADLGASLAHLGGQGGDDAVKKLQELGNAAAASMKLTDALGGSVVTLKADGENVTLDVKDNTPEVEDKLKALGVHLQQMADDPTHLQLIPDTPEAKKILDDFRAGQNNTPLTPAVKPDLTQANADMQNFVDHWRTAVLGIQPPNLPLPPPAPTTPGQLILPPAGRATGGPVFGAGTATSDSIPAWLSHGEHVWTAAEVDKLGGQAAMYRLRRMVKAGALSHFDSGGSVGGGIPLTLMPDVGPGGSSEWHYAGPGWADPNAMPQGGWGLGGKLAYQAYLRGDIPNPDYWKQSPGSVIPGFAGGGMAPMAVPWGVDPRGGKNADAVSGPFPAWWDMDWMPPEHPQNVSPGPGKWWSRGPTPGAKDHQAGHFAPPIGKLRKPRSGDSFPGWIPDWRIKSWGFANGGAVGPDVSAAQALVGTQYSKGKRTDCSGMVARVIDRTLGMPETGLMTTKTAKEWLAARGFKPGAGGAGQISVGWYDHGPGENDGHMAMTLSDGENAEAGGSHGLFLVGAGAAGASNPEFDQHMFLPTLYGEGPAGSGSGPTSPFAGGSAAAAVTGAPAASSGGSAPATGGGGGSSFSVPSSIGDLASFGLDNLGKGVGTTKAGSDLSLFGKAAGAAVSGQVDSALGVLGVNGSPGWLKAISTLASGISIGGKSAAPLSAKSTGTGTPPPDDPGNMHGTRAGQAPGPVYNITARDTEDAFVKAQRIEREKAAAKLSRF